MCKSHVVHGSEKGSMNWQRRGTSRYMRESVRMMKCSVGETRERGGAPTHNLTREPTSSDSQLARRVTTHQGLAGFPKIRSGVTYLTTGGGGGMV